MIFPAVTPPEASETVPAPVLPKVTLSAELNQVVVLLRVQLVTDVAASHVVELPVHVRFEMTPYELAAICVCSLLEYVQFAAVAARVTHVALFTEVVVPL